MNAISLKVPVQRRPLTVPRRGWRMASRARQLFPINGLSSSGHLGLLRMRSDRPRRLPSHVAPLRRTRLRLAPHQVRGLLL